MEHCPVPPALTRVAYCAQDERLGELDTHPKYGSHRLVLTKMHLQQLLRGSELAGFAAVLMPHQKAVRAGSTASDPVRYCVRNLSALVCLLAVQVAGDGFSLLDRAVLEHNLGAMAQIYSNIPLQELGAVLGLDPDRAEKVSLHTRSSPLLPLSLSLSLLLSLRAHWFVDCGLWTVVLVLAHNRALSPRNLDAYRHFADSGCDDHGGASGGIHRPSRYIANSRALAASPCS